MKLIRLSEGITHIEDLSFDRFLAAVKNLNSYFCSEKIDGANLWFGLDGDGKLFTTREQKSKDKDRKYSSKDYSNVSAYNGFRAAHAALESQSEIIKRVLKPNEFIEIEVVFGTQPNVVKYTTDGNNYIVLLRPVNGTSDEAFDKLAKALSSVETSASSSFIDTSDGESISTTDKTTRWKFLKNIELPVSSDIIPSNGLKPLITKLENFSNSVNTEASAVAGKQLTNREVLSYSTAKIKIGAREQFKLVKEKTNETLLLDYKMPIKHFIMKSLLDSKKFLSTKLGADPDQGTIEGFVLSKGDELIKIVDRDLFTAINEFNFKIRNELNGAVMSNDIDAPLEFRGGLLGTSKIRIANLFDLADLAKTSSAKKIFNSYKGQTPNETINAFTKSLKIVDFQQFKIKILAIIRETQRELKTKLDKFKNESESYKVKLKTGKTITYSDESKKRSLLAFAELKQELQSLEHKIKRSISINEIIKVIYGRIIDEIHGEAPRNKKLAESKKMDFSLIKDVSSTINEEDGGGAASGGEAGAETSPAVPAAGTTAGAIAPFEFKIFKGKMIRRVKRNFSPKKKKHK